VTTARPRRATKAATRTAAKAPTTARTAGTTATDELDIAILRYLRRTPNRFVDLGPLAEELGVEPFHMQLAVERLHRLRLLQAPFIEPGTAGGAEMTERGLRWLIEREGGRPAEVPVALKPATQRVRAEAEAARLPRAQVYGLTRH
jgi:hypothetical protein